MRNSTWKTVAIPLIVAVLIVGGLASVAMAQDEPYSDTEVGGEVITPNPPAPAAPTTKVLGQTLPVTGADLVLWGGIALAALAVGTTAVIGTRSRLSQRRR